MKGIPDMGKVERRLEELERRREALLSLSRELIRLAGKAITLMHARRLAEAAALLARMRRLERRLKAGEKGMEYFSQQAHQEYVEAIAFYTVLKERRLVSPAESGSGEVPYLLGVMDLVGELKREIIDAIRAREYALADEYYALMKGIYDSTRHFRFANSVVPDFRRKQDTARIQLESAAGELLAAGAGKAELQRLK
jgi:translin